MVGVLGCPSRGLLWTAVPSGSDPALLAVEPPQLVVPTDGPVCSEEGTSGGAGAFESECGSSSPGVSTSGIVRIAVERLEEVVGGRLGLCLVLELVDGLLVLDEVWPRRSDAPAWPAAVTVWRVVAPGASGAGAEVGRGECLG